MPDPPLPHQLVYFLFLPPRDRQRMEKILEPNKTKEQQQEVIFGNQK